MRRRAKQGRTASPLVVQVSRLDLPVPKNARIDPLMIRLATTETPEVSIIIPAYGKADMTLRCLASLHLAAPDVPYEVIVVEDASGEAGAERPGLVPGVRFIANEQNLGFLRSCNAAARMARGRYLLLLNNDTQVLPGAVEALRHTFDIYSDAGLVGSKLVYPDGRLQEAGGIVWSDGSARNHGRFGDRLAPEYNYLRETDYVSGASIMVDAALWRQLGGFDERFCPAYYEDTDLAMQIHQAGRLVIYQPASTVVHLEGVSSGTDTSAGVKRFQDINAEKFLDKWREVLQRDHYANSPHNIFPACNRARHQPIVLVTNDMVVQPDVDAGSRAIAQSMEALLAMGCVIKFWPENPFEFSQYAEQLRQQGIEVIAGARRPAFKAWIQAHGRHIDHAILHRPEQTAVFLPLVRQHAPQAHIVYYGHDLHYQRIQAQAELQGSAQLKAAAAQHHAIEVKIWKSADVSVYFSQEEVDTVQAQCPQANVRAVQAYCFDEVVVPQRPIASRQLIFVAGFGHPPNVDAARWLVKEVMPKVWAREPDVQLSLVGSKPTAEVQALASAQVAVTGWVSDEQLAELYTRSRAAVVPLRFGAGVKHKVVEAMSRGVPLVTTSVGAQGLPGLEHASAIADEADALAQHIVTLLRDDAAWMRLVERAAAYIHDHFSRASLQDQMLRLLHTAH
ncbi:glycosyltransferase [Azohydromonas caseinilytica]|uniref:Glycosyltransferase n=1 Tax=Azohydromonas caseinilytica TaxID=2728836 RepID=A0A848F287_9BURK|nr:glycosyltransferase [Azohydromonas caseinilytica]NML14167.1 glycosyltransferase [Azohydromonas caseinilytica]